MRKWAEKDYIAWLLSNFFYLLWNGLLIKRLFGVFDLGSMTSELATPAQIFERARESMALSKWQFWTVPMLFSKPLEIDG